MCPCWPAGLFVAASYVCTWKQAEILSKQLGREVGSSTWFCFPVLVITYLSLFPLNYFSLLGFGVSASHKACHSSAWSGWQRGTSWWWSSQGTSPRCSNISYPNKRAMQALRVVSKLANGAVTDATATLELQAQASSAWCLACHGPQYVSSFPLFQMISVFVSNVAALVVSPLLSWQERSSQFVLPGGSVLGACVLFLYFKYESTNNFSKLECQRQWEQIFFEFSQQLFVYKRPQ